MDLFTEKANNILKYVLKEKQEQVVYSSEEDAETVTDVSDESLKQLGVTPQTVAAVQVASKLGATDPQKQQALKAEYARLMDKLSQRLKGINV
jgi:hypothetical protein